MSNQLILSHEQHEALWKHLLQNSKEQVAFVFAQARKTDFGLTLEAREIHLVSEEELLDQESYHISLTDKAQAELIKVAWAKKAALVELHCHLGFQFPSQFSYSDLLGLEEFVPHVRWRLKGEPYAALVVGPNDFDGLVWIKDSPELLDAVIVNGQILSSTALTLRALQSEADADHD
ncbi:MAG TPA: hypothetical protein VJB57_19905 [Dehalococcoidia bacterium]|nr:hypothetical protein [Dehalococcoidia bacterium]